MFVNLVILVFLQRQTRSMMHSMAEHEMEMTRQMMSVPPGPPNPPGVSTNLPPPGPPTTRVLPPPNVNTSVPPPPLLPTLPPMQNPNWGDDLSPTDNGNANELPSLMSMKVDKPDDMKNKSPSEVILPKALEDVFAFKDQLAGELGRTDGELPIDVTEKSQKNLQGVISNEYGDVDGDSDDDELQTVEEVASRVQSRLDKNKKKKRRKRQNRQKRQASQRDNEDKRFDKIVENDKVKNGSTDDVAIEYVPDKITVAELAPMYRQFYRVFEIFKLEDKPSAQQLANAALDEKNFQTKKDKEKAIDDDDADMEEEKKDDKEKLSKRKLKKLTRLSVAELKQLVNRPDVVEMHDVTARDPKLLVQLKAHRNTVQVPRHWCFKRKYLQGKRGIEKPPFDLPAFIKKTGIMEMRASLQEKDEAKTLKAKMRERARPKMGKIDIDYQKLHDAFFK